jgi:aspartate 1-decarboxylase
MVTYVIEGARNTGEVMLKVRRQIGNGWRPVIIITYCQMDDAELKKHFPALFNGRRTAC